MAVLQCGLVAQPFRDSHLHTRDVISISESMLTLMTQKICALQRCILSLHVSIHLCSKLISGQAEKLVAGTLVPEGSLMACQTCTLLVRNLDIS